MDVKIGRIYVINLPFRTERMNLFRSFDQQWITAFGQRPVRLSAIAGISLAGYDEKPWFANRISERRKKSWGGKAGAILSHRNAIKQAADQNLGSVLILEDDAFLTAEMANLWKNQLSMLLEALPEDWALINLCTTHPINPCRVVSEREKVKLVEAAGSFGAVAYILNGRVFEKLLRELPDEASIWPWVARYKTIDRWFSRNLMRFGKVYLFAPSIVGHQGGSSDITMSPGTDHLLDFSLPNIRYTNNKYIFKITKCFRRAINGCAMKLTIFRLVVKFIRGL